MCYVNKKPTFQRETQLFPTVFLDILSKIQITLTGTSYLNLKKVNNLTVCIILEFTFILIIFEQIYKLAQCLKNDTSTACFHRKYYFSFFHFSWSFSGDLHLYEILAGKADKKCKMIRTWPIYIFKIQFQEKENVNIISSNTWKSMCKSL